MAETYIPHGYQAYCTERIISDSSLGLFLDMGLGKTVITLTAVNELIYNRFEVGKVLVIAPKKVAESTWSTEAKKWGHLKHLRVSKILGTVSQRIRGLNTPADIYVINRENVPWLVDYDSNAWRFDMVVVDELSSFKSNKAQRFKSLCYVRQHISRFVGLTGTPASNGLTDLWAQVYLLDGGERLGKKITHFRTRYCECETHGGHFTTYSMKPGAEESIKAAISDICVSMKAEDYLRLPDCITVDVPVLLDAKAKKQYEKFEKDMLLQIDENTLDAGTAAVLSGKLLQFANGAVYNENKTAVELHSCKLDVLAELIEGLNGQHALLFYNFQHDLTRITDRFAKSGLVIRQLKTDKDQQDWNDGKIDILLAHPASAGYGLNLQQGGHHIIWFGLNWSLELYEQANKRLHRQGQREAVIVHRLITQGTRDVDVAAALEGKSDVQNALLEALKARIKEIKSGSPTVGEQKF
ncbi:MAG: DEAD/DEAH box helicase [Oscillospiraceae bacterium]|nr:DEAD/DEAH box helicase [Oscillospiraceae bacterium]